MNCYATTCNVLCYDLLCSMLWLAMCHNPNMLHYNCNLLYYNLVQFVLWSGPLQIAMISGTSPVIRNCYATCYAMRYVAIASEIPSFPRKCKKMWCSTQWTTRSTGYIVQSPDTFFGPLTAPQPICALDTDTPSKNEGLTSFLTCLLTLLHDPANLPCRLPFWNVSGTPSHNTALAWTSALLKNFWKGLNAQLALSASSSRAIFGWKSHSFGDGIQILTNGHGQAQPNLFVDC